MAAIQPLRHLMGNDTSMLTHQEKCLLEAVLFSHICEELKEIFREQYRDYFQLLNLTLEKENHMLETRFAQFIVNDIISTGEYTSLGIAYYTDSFEEVVEEIRSGRNTNPSGILLRKLIDLHCSVRREQYEMIIRKTMRKFERSD